MEAPIGNALSTTTPQGQITSIVVNRDDCSSVRIVVDNPDHGAALDIMLATPTINSSRRSFVQSVETEFRVPDIQASAVIHTGDY